MSADNWAICPKCKHMAEVTRERLRHDAVEQYGKIPIEDWEKIRDQSLEPIKLQEAFREDYEQWMDEDGTYQQTYSGHCTVCGFAYKHEYTEKVKLD